MAMAPLSAGTRRSQLPAVLLLVAGCMVAYWAAGDAFTGAPLAAGRDGSRVAMGDKESRARGKARRKTLQRQNIKASTVEGRKVPNIYKQMLGAQETDTPWDVKQAGNGKTVTVEFQKLPHGIARWQPGAGFKGARVKDVGYGVYVGDPHGQARAGGVERDMVVKEINGKNVLGEDFDKIMSMIADPALAFNANVELPMKVTFAAN
eukprot:gb/GFBE01065780.1/.p1 GENE.gb/GFBE01065780.1/~~gb/GFBE01065780.1/.p1  ORF type:complete len:206 (+),score=53.90 gb/GFBE01065780.1/:1-618(+)